MSAKGDLAKAVGAFERAGHAQMALRVGEKLAKADERDRREQRHEKSERDARGANAEAAEARGQVAAAFEELDAGEISFSLAEPITGSQQAGTWRAVEPGAPTGAVSERHAGDGWTVPPSAEAVASMHAEEVAGIVPSEGGATPLPSPPGMPGRNALAIPMPLTHLARASRLVFPETAGVRLQPSGAILVRTTGSAQGGGRPFAARVESVRVHVGAIVTEALPRKTRGKSTGESFGGVA